MPPCHYALFGSPIEHSPSPAMHNAAFKALGIESSYHLRPAEVSQVSELHAELREGRWRGANVTTPLKTAMAREGKVLLQGSAQRAGAVNTLLMREGRCEGWLTDIEGVQQPLEQRGYEGGGIGLVIGSGGAARAAVLALDAMETEIHLACRRPEVGEALLEELQPKWPGSVSSLKGVEETPDPDLAMVISWASMIVQATPVGHQGESHHLPWSALGRRRAPIAFEMLYHPRQTQFLKDAEAHRCPLIEGWEMLLAQGVCSFEIWTGREAPRDVMQEAVLEHLEHEHV